MNFFSIISLHLKIPLIYIFPPSKNDCGSNSFLCSYFFYSYRLLFFLSHILILSLSVFLSIGFFFFVYKLVQFPLTLQNKTSSTSHPSSTSQKASCSMNSVSHYPLPPTLSSHKVENLVS